MHPLVSHIQANGKNASWSDLAIQFGFTTGEAARSFYKRYRATNKIVKGFLGKMIAVDNEDVVSVKQYKPSNDYSFRQSGDDTEIKTQVEQEIRNPEDLAKALNIDLDTYTVKSFWCKKDGNKDYYNITANFGRNKGGQMVKEIKEFLDEYTPYDYPAFLKTIKERKAKDIGSKIGVLNVFDLHLAKLAWDEETGENYDIRIAQKRFESACYYLVEEALKNEELTEIVLCTGGDFFHSDNKNSTTTSGTWVQSDSRYQKIFKVGIEALSNVLSYIRERVPVTFINIPGNHDEQTSYYLGEVIEAIFKNDEMVSVDNTLRSRKFFIKGEVAIMFAHGDKGTDRLPGLFYQEMPVVKGYKCKEIHLGHLHRSYKKMYITEDESNGLLFRHFNSLSATDAWHMGEGYIGAKKKAAMSMYDTVKGERTSQISYTI